MRRERATLTQEADVNTQYTIPAGFSNGDDTNNKEHDEDKDEFVTEVTTQRRLSNKVLAGLFGLNSPQTQS